MLWHKNIEGTVVPSKKLALETHGFDHFPHGKIRPIIGGGGKEAKQPWISLRSPMTGTQNRINTLLFGNHWKHLETIDWELGYTWIYTLYTQYTHCIGWANHANPSSYFMVTWNHGPMLAIAPPRYVAHSTIWTQPPGHTNVFISCHVLSHETHQILSRMYVQYNGEGSPIKTFLKRGDTWITAWILVFQTGPKQSQHELFIVVL